MPFPEWGDVPGTIEGWSTLLGFTAVAVTLKMQLNDRRASQASQVDYILAPVEYGPPVFRKMLSHDPAPDWKPPRMLYGQKTDDPDNLWLCIMNRSDNSIHEVTLWVPFCDQEKVPEQLVNIGKVPPGDSYYRYTDIVPTKAQQKAYPPGQMVTLIQFNDQNNRIWQRAANGELRAITRRTRHKWFREPPDQL